MEHQLCVLLYSKYSQLSSKLINIIENSTVNLETNIALRKVCIDNEEIRKQILRTNTIDVKCVPCILLIYNNGGVEKYEGDNAFYWIEETINKYIQLQPNNSKYYNVEETIQNKQRKQKPIKNNNSNKEIKSTSISEILSSSEDDNISVDEEIQVKPPPASIRSNLGNYEITEGFGKIEESKQNITTISKTKNSNDQGSNLMSVAMAMQKEREISESKKNNSSITKNIQTNSRPI